MPDLELLVSTILVLYIGLVLAVLVFINKAYME